MKNLCRWAFAITMICFGLAARPAKAEADAPTADIVFRPPFTLKLHVDKEHYYEQKFEAKIPFVDKNNNVYLFAGESFGLKLGVTGGKIATVAYQKEKSGTDIELDFKQEKQENGRAMMMLTLKSNIKQTLYLDAIMVVPGQKKPCRTNLLPVHAGLESFEMWPHPIVQLVLTNLRFQEKTPADASQGTLRSVQQR